MDAVNHLRLTVHPNQIRPTLRALLHAIFFHRLTDPLDPDTIEIYDTHVATNSSSTIDKDVNARIDEFCREFVDKGATYGEIAVVLLQRRPKKGWFAITEELIPWEEHLISLNFPPVRYGVTTPPNVLPAALLQLLTFCAEKSGNVPPLSGNEGGTTNISYQILVAPPPPSELFAPSPPLNPARLTSPPPGPSTTTTPATALARDVTLPLNTAVNEALDARDPSREAGRRGSSPAAYGERDRGAGTGGYGYGYGYGHAGAERGSDRERERDRQGGGAMGYFEQAKDGLRAVGARAGAVAGWTGRGGPARQ